MTNNFSTSLLEKINYRHPLLNDGWPQGAPTILFITTTVLGSPHPS